MRRGLWAWIGWVLIWPVCSWSATQPLELKVKDDVLLSEAMKGGLSLTLPEFLVFTGNGAAIFHEKGFNSSFMDIVELAMQSGTPLEGKPALPEVLAAAVNMDNSPLSHDVAAKYEFVFVEYWADWCAPCHQQKKAIAEYFAQHPDEKILWLYIRRDPTLLPELSVQKSE